MVESAYLFVILGTGFNQTIAENKVTSNGIQPGITSATNTKTKTAVSEQLTTGEIYDSLWSTSQWNWSGITA